jgi:hypothetical protein
MNILRFGLVIPRSKQSFEISAASFADTFETSFDG